MFEQLDSLHPLLTPVVGVLALLAGGVIIDLIAKRLLVGAVRAFAKRSSFTWDDALVTHNVFGRLAQVVPALIVFVGVTFVLSALRATDGCFASSPSSASVISPAALPPASTQASLSAASASAA